MENIYAMLSRVDFLDEVRETERISAAERLHNEICAFVAHYGYASTDECPSTGCSYSLLRDGLILRKKEEEGESVTIRDLSIEEMEFIRKFMVDTINRDSQYIDDEIGRYQNLCL